MSRSRPVLRSWLWNVTAAVVLAFLAAGCVVLTIRASAPEAVQFLLGAIAVVLAAGAARVSTVGVRATPDALIVRELFRTRKLPWSAVKRARLVTYDPPTFGAPSVSTAMPELHYVLDGRRRRVRVTSLGARRVVVAERNVEELNEFIRTRGGR